MIQFRHSLKDCKCLWQRRRVLDFQVLRELVIKHEMQFQLSVRAIGRNPMVLQFKRNVISGTY